MVESRRRSYDKWGRMSGNGMIEEGKELYQEDVLK